MTYYLIHRTTRPFLVNSLSIIGWFLQVRSLAPTVKYLFAFSFSIWSFELRKNSNPSENVFISVILTQCCMYSILETSKFSTLYLPVKMLYFSFLLLIFDQKKKVTFLFWMRITNSPEFSLFLFVLLFFIHSCNCFGKMKAGSQSLISSPWSPPLVTHTFSSKIEGTIMCFTSISW